MICEFYWIFSQVIGRAGPPKTGKGSNSVSPALSSDQLHGGGGEGLEEGKRQITPDIIKVTGSLRLGNCTFWEVATWENTPVKMPLGKILRESS